jgi:hypothetical protein
MLKIRAIPSNPFFFRRTPMSKSQDIKKDSKKKPTKTLKEKKQEKKEKKEKKKGAL